MKSKAYIVDIDGNIRENPDFPIAILRQNLTKEGDPLTSGIVDPVFNDKIARNLYGRIMTLVEATTDPVKLKSVKDVFSKELKTWEQDVYKDAYEHSERALSTLE